MNDDELGIDGCCIRVTANESFTIISLYFTGLYTNEEHGQWLVWWHTPFHSALGRDGR